MIRNGCASCSSAKINIEKERKIFSAKKERTTRDDRLSIVFSFSSDKSFENSNGFLNLEE